MNQDNDLRLAVLIDADNIPSSNIEGMLEEVTKYGTPTFKRIYGDWTKPNLNGWKSVLLENAITPIQQYGYTTGKNATDSAMIIDAMDILYSGRVDGFCLVSSDSDFTRLATRLREAGMKVYGIGEKKTPIAFISACNKFIYLEILEKQQSTDDELDKKNQKSISKTTVSKIDSRLIKFITESIEDLADDDGWAFVGALGSHLLKKQPNFDPRNYGHSKLVPLLKEIKKFSIDERSSGKEHIKNVYVKLKS